MPSRWRFVVVLGCRVSWLIEVNGFIVDGEEFNLHSEFVYEDGLTALKLVEGTNPGEDVEDCVVVFDAVVGHQGEGNAAVVGMDAFVAFCGFGVGINREELGGDGCGDHFVNW